MLPRWLSDKTNEISKSGTLVVSNCYSFDVTAFRLPMFSIYLSQIKTIDLSGTCIFSLDGFPKMRSLSTFIANNSQISSFKNFSILRGISSIYLKNTPVSASKNYGLCVSIMLLPELRSMDGKVIADRNKAKASSIDPHVSLLLDKGWDMPYPIPSIMTIMNECEKYGIPFDEKDEEGQYNTYSDDEFDVSQNESNSSDHIVHVSENDKKLARGLAEIFNSYGENINPSDYNTLYQRLADIVLQM
ncbi:hypothetical protein TVAG_332910 [Trichomonas vaginalis G3]|uniref:Leucine Rich Repeat family protein n=1 Tax=Trichomonas vaginalis (strain ATCC PRA-98 / G3) TaxID=412133 RepID=A2EH87_TRIV3|nr:ribonuclease inhibitor domain-containing protein [Trichomonas vaginalis G3]EAY07966.1 hypothetical protein TVAG_332910 [Trichomonas vaginalis G3]KAI5486013.1 ribonuclease inhibitor domain-containing protein [Trichomonas vaginalis G3]|eukprot:XP_001320189.1 hypothetical protein [Trichomonas vaginalis G3]